MGLGVNFPAHGRVLHAVGLVLLLGGVQAAEPHLQERHPPGVVGPDPRVVVDAEKIQLGADGFHVARLHIGRRPASQLQQPIGISTAKERVETDRVEHRVTQLRRQTIRWDVLARMNRHQVEGDADLRLRPRALHGLGRETVGQQQVVNDLHVEPGSSQARSVPSCRVTHHREDLRLVQRDEVTHAIAQRRGHTLGEIGEVARAVAVGEPTQLLLQRSRKIPVEERDVRCHASLQQGIHESIVEGDPRRVGGSSSVGHHPGPRDREAIGVQPQLADQADVLGPCGARGRTPRHPCCHRGYGRGCARRHPRWRDPCRPRPTPPRSGTRRSMLRTRTMEETDEAWSRAPRSSAAPSVGHCSPMNEVHLVTVTSPAEMRPIRSARSCG